MNSRSILIKLSHRLRRHFSVTHKMSRMDVCANDAINSIHTEMFMNRRKISTRVYKNTHLWESSKHYYSMRNVKGIFCSLCFYKWIIFGCTDFHFGKIDFSSINILFCKLYILNSHEFLLNKKIDMGNIFCRTARNLRIWVKIQVNKQREK